MAADGGEDFTLTRARCGIMVTVEGNAIRAENGRVLDGFPSVIRVTAHAAGESAVSFIRDGHDVVDIYRDRDGILLTTLVQYGGPPVALSAGRRELVSDGSRSSFRAKSKAESSLATSWSSRSTKGAMRPGTSTASMSGTVGSSGASLRSNTCRPTRPASRTVRSTATRRIASSQRTARSRWCSIRRTAVSSIGSRATDAAAIVSCSTGVEATSAEARGAAPQ